MSDTNEIFLELSKDMGFEIENGRVIAVIGGNDKENMRQDVQRIGSDMRRVLSRAHG